jgi:hypothetical protein
MASEGTVRKNDKMWEEKECNVHVPFRPTKINK